jgi:hypothetical protein
MRHEPEACPNPVRLAQINDIPWILSLASERYRHFDPGRTLSWLVEVVRSPIALVIRTDHAFLIASIVTPVWHPKEPECHVLFLCAAPGRHWEAVRLLRFSTRWGREQGCLRWWFSSETDYAIDALAKRVGARPAVQRYRLDL